jgi:hypothetical protein
MPPLTVTTDPRDVFSTGLYNSLGTFWTRFYTDRNFVNSLCKGDSLLAAQTYINFLEAAACLCRKTVPVFHRERWFPVVIRQSEADTGSGVRIYFGIQPPIVLGPQPPGTAYAPNQEFAIGGNAVKRGLVSYPAHAENFSSGMLTLSSDIVAPEATYLLNVDYYVSRNSIVFKSELDPFSSGKFIARTVIGASGTKDREIVLWGSDVLIDRNYVPGYFGYLQGLPLNSDEYGAEATDAVLELRAGGTSLASVTKNLGRLFSTPVVVNGTETVANIYTGNAGITYVITDSSAYACRPEETLSGKVFKGAVLHLGDFITNTVRFYSSLNPDKFQTSTGYTLEQFVADVPRLSLPKGLVSGEGLDMGISVPWAQVPVTYQGLDGNGHAKLKFEVSSDPAVSDQYWSQVWRRCEDRDVDMAALLAEYLYGTAFVEGVAVGMINPMQFFMKNCLNQNTSVLVVDFDAIPEYIKSLDMLYELNRVTAAHALMILVARNTMTEEPYGLGAQYELVTQMKGRRLQDIAGEAGSLTYMDFKPTFRRVQV